jgi:electron transfer flavoprotein alpha subunit
VHLAALGEYAPQAWARAIAGLGASTIVAAGSDRGNEVLAHAAVMTGGVFAANVTEAAGDDIVRMRWGGSLLEEARLHGDVRLMTVAPHAVAIEAAEGEPEVREFAPELHDADLVVRVSERVDTSTGGLSLAEAPVVVSGGRGVGSAEGFGPLEELASLLGGVVGCSRAVTSAGWRPHTDQVGQTGTKISPELYIPCGISGATQHMAGCKGAKKLLAINSDPEAPIMTTADYAVVGDVLEIVPAISAELRRVRGAG